MILALLHEGKRDWNSDTKTNSLTSGPRSPTKMLYSGPRSSLKGVSQQAAPESTDHDAWEHLPTINKTTARRPVELEDLVGVGNRGTI